MQNYTTIKINDQTVGLKFGLPAVRQIYQKSILSELSDGNGNYNEFGYAHIMYAGYCNNCLVKEMTRELTLEDFMDFVEQCTISSDFAQIVSALTVYQESKTIKTLAEVGKKIGELKKKQATIQSKKKTPASSRRRK